MDFCRNIPLSGGLTSEYQPDQLCSKLGSLDDLFSGHSTEGDVNLEWLSIFVEDCLSSTGNCLPPQILPPNPQKITSPATATATTTATTNPKPQIPKPLVHEFLIPSKARTKRKRSPLSMAKNPLTSWSHHFNRHGKTFQITNSDPPLLQQAYWLADSELILPKKGEILMREREVMDDDDERESIKEEEESLNLGQQQTRRCSHCLSQRTPQWRAGPLGPKTLCNACGVRYKSGRLLPEYRPAKSPTFVSYKHSNSHKKVLEMRMSSSSSSSSNS